MLLTSVPSELIAVVDTIDPDANAAGTINGGYVAFKDFQHMMAIVLNGTMGSSGTLDFKLQQAQDASGTGVKDITGAAITQLTDAGSDSDKQAIINLRQDDLDIANDFTHVRMVLTTATATGDSAAILLGVNPVTAPASDYDDSTVDEIVTV